MRIVLDTGVFYHPDALEALSRLPHDVVVPAVTFTERARQLAKREVPPGELASALAANEMLIEPYGRREAERFAVGVTDDGAGRRLARDAMIAGHVGPEDVLWTTNPRDFQALGLPDEQVVPVAGERATG